MRFLFVCLIGLLVSVEARPVSSPVISGQVRLVDGCRWRGRRWCCLT